MRIGTTTFGFRYQLLDRARAPSLERVAEQARGLGLDVLQICENARPMDLGESQWAEVVRRAGDIGLELQLGCKTTALGVFRGYLDRAAALPACLLRVVLEEEEGRAPERADVDRFLAAAWPLIERSGARLAIENHFDVPSRVLAEAVAPYPAGRIGFCVDTANSLRNFETPEMVLDLLGSRALCYHVKDFRVDGDKLGFRVAGAPLGEGRLDLDATLERIFRHNPAPELFVENWTPGSGDWETDVREDELWLRRGLDTLKQRLRNRGIS
ncbi:MAG: sugar phosphate isomerase/epimerase [Acidobacteria bacterium]|nr:sugar phosphate isomerase/epimerase [Acidobacteriota bacterium]